jgi:serine protease inhibitor ecotin
MTRPKRNDETINLTKQELLRALTEDDAMKKLMQTLLQEVLEAEMDQTLLAGKSERTAGRLGYSGIVTSIQRTTTPASTSMGCVNSPSHGRYEPLPQSGDAGSTLPRTPPSAWLFPRCER